MFMSRSTIKQKSINLPNTMQILKIWRMNYKSRKMIWKVWKKQPMKSNCLMKTSKSHLLSAKYLFRTICPRHKSWLPLRRKKKSKRSKLSKRNANKSKNWWAISKRNCIFDSEQISTWKMMNKTKRYSLTFHMHLTWIFFCFFFLNWNSK